MARKVELLPGVDGESVACWRCGAKAGESCLTRGSFLPRPREPHAARIKLANDRRSTDA